MAQGLTFEYEPRPVIESIKLRQLWLLAGNDRQAPYAGTQVILGQIQRKRPNLAVVVFPNADHGLVESKKAANGVVLAYSAKLFDLTANWITQNKRSMPKRIEMMLSSK
jgi:uncharacterized protein